MTTAERAALFRRCERFLGGHGVVMPRQALAALADEAGADEASDVYGEGEMIERFERDVAELLGKPAALFMPSGTMAQQIAVRIWSQRRGRGAMAFHPSCHLEAHEERGYALLHGLHARPVGDSRRLLRRADLDKVSEPIAVLVLELPQRDLGGQLPAWDELEAQAGWARDRGAALHLDGARLWETQPFYDRGYAAICAPFDTVYVSFYKVLGAIAGAALAGPADFIAEARPWLRRHGGNLVTQYPFVLSARAGLRARLPRIPAYVRRARSLALALGALPSVRVIPDPPQTNMMHLVVAGEAERLLDGSAAVAADEKVCLFTRVRATDVPGLSIVEIVVGDGALALDDELVASLFARVLAGACP